MKKKSRSVSPADALLDAHVAFILERLDAPALVPQLEQLLDLALTHLGDLELESLVTCQTVQATARTYAVELDLRGGIPELVGDMARALHAHPVHAQTRLGDLLSQRRFEDLLDHLLALKSIRRRLIDEVVASPLYERIASELLYNGIRDYLAGNATAGGVTSAIPGARSALRLGRAMASRVGLDDAVEDSVKRYIGRSVRRVSDKTVQALLDGEHDDALRDVALDSWQRLRDLRVGELTQDLSSLDVEELFVTLYECWKSIRATTFIGAMIDTGIATFFDKYGRSSLAALLEDLGIDRAIMLGEARRFAPGVLARLRDTGRLEPLVRALLEPFYASGRVEQVLGAR